MRRPDHQRSHRYVDEIKARENREYERGTNLYAYYWPKERPIIVHIARGVFK